MVELLTHHYGPDVRLLDDAFLSTLLGRIGSPKIGTAEIPNLVRTAYQRLLHEILAIEFPRTRQRQPTRMTAQEPRAFVEGSLLCKDTKLVICSVIRAGMLPAQLPYRPTVFELHRNGRLFPPNYLHETWMDYLYWDTELEPYV